MGDLDLPRLAGLVGGTYLLNVTVYLFHAGKTGMVPVPALLPLGILSLG